VKWNIVSVRLEIVYYRCNIGARFVANVPSAEESYWTHLMEILGDMAQVEACFGPFGDSVSVGAI
jgi:hypothetical protein